MNTAPFPAFGTYADGFEPVARTFASQLASGAEIGAAVSIYHRGENVVDLWGGKADRERDTPFERNTRIVLFSITKGLVSMALSLLGDRGALEWDAPVAHYWPGFAKNRKGAITLRQLFNHQAGLCALDEPFTLEACTDRRNDPRLALALEKQRPLWEPGRGQGYHAVTFGMYARELFERIANEPLGSFLCRELFEPLGADVSLGTPAEFDARIARLYPASERDRVVGVARAMAERAMGREASMTEARILRAVMTPYSLTRRAFLNPSVGKLRVLAYDRPQIWRAELAWASATGSADGIARAYLPFARGGMAMGRRFLREETLAPLYERQDGPSAMRFCRNHLVGRKDF
jgi:CubicO group peptidase (beta-lactamase class C family)